MTGGDLRSKCCPQVRWCPLSACSMRCQGDSGRRPRRAGLRTASRMPWRCGVRARVMRWTPTCCCLAQMQRRQGLQPAVRLDRRQCRLVPAWPDADPPARLVQKPVTKAEDLQGVKFRTVGISIDVFTGLGAAVNALPGGSSSRRWTAGCRRRRVQQRIVDRIPGFPDVSRSACCRATTRTPSSSRSCSTKTVDSCPKNKAIIAVATEAAGQAWRGRRSTAIPRFTKRCRPRTGQVLQDPGLSPAKQLKSAIRSSKKSADNPLFEIVRSQMAFAKRATQWEQDTVVNAAWPITALRPERQEEDLTQ